MKIALSLVTALFAFSGTALAGESYGGYQKNIREHNAEIAKRQRWISEDTQRISNYDQMDAKLRDVEGTSNLVQKCQKLNSAVEFFKSTNSPSKHTFAGESDQIKKRIKKLGKSVEKASGANCAQIQNLADSLDND